MTMALLGFLGREQLSTVQAQGPLRMALTLTALPLWLGRATTRVTECQRCPPTLSWSYVYNEGVKGVTYREASDEGHL